MEPDNEMSLDDPLRAAVQTLMDAHEQWHDAFEAYHQPNEFRRHVDTAVQSLRNVTFRLQSQKSRLGDDFDEWYGQWRDYMKAQDELRWLNDARVEIVKRSGLHASSVALVQLYDSYLEPATKVSKLPANWSTQCLVDKVVQSIPKEYRPYSAVAVARRWQVPKFETQELLAVLAHCWHVLDALLIYAKEVQERPVDDPPGQFVRSVEFPDCMSIDASSLQEVFAADTGAGIRHTKRLVERDDDQLEVAAKRYRLRATDVSADSPIAERASLLHEVARTLFKKDKVHYPALFFRHPERGWLVRSFLAEDKRDKFLLWHTFSWEVARFGYDAYILTTESWQSPVPETVTPYYEVSESPQRREALDTFFETSEGDGGLWSSQIVRVGGRPYLRRAVFHEIDPTNFTFASPVRKVFRQRRIADSGSERNSTVQGHE